VKTAEGAVHRVTLRHGFGDFDSMLFADAPEMELLATAVSALGGRSQVPRVSVMQPFNLPGGAAIQVQQFWNQFFPMRPGHWAGWEFETYPVITEIAFQDAERTRARARVTLGYGGTTVVLVKENGIWRAIALDGRWVT
jgi:hypothetical protein